jgi:imidazolonepropionase-like amidohydrolase/sugar lactone lactonase YvrE
MKSTSIACLVLTAAWAAVWSTVASPQTLPPAAGTATLFEGARLIAGDGSAPIDNSAFVVQNNRFVRIGKKGEITLPQGAAAVDLSGKTVMPALIEVHAHLGYFKTNTERRPSAAHFTREQLLNDLQQFAYYGVGSVLSLGADRREVVYQVRDEWRAAPPPNTARFFTAGQGLAAPNAGPAGELENAVYPVTSEADARKDVQELAAHKVDGWVKIWHDSRRGKMPLPVIQAIIDEAHKQKLRVAAHIQELQDFKDLLRMGIDVLAHPTWRQESVPPVDDELIALLKEHPNVFMCTTFWTPRNQIYGARPEWIDEPILNETFSPQEIKALENPSTPRDAAEKWATGRVPQAMKTLKLAGVGFVLGTDMGGGGAGYYGFSSHVEMESMVKAGLTASEAIVAATRNSARMLGIDDLGTIAAGKTADFIVLDANPLDNIANTRRISNVYLGGQLVDRDGLRAKWAVRSAAVPYRPVDNWAHLPAGMAWGAVTSASTDADGNVYIFRRAQPPILKLNAHGEFVRSLGETLIAAAHGIRIDASGFIWAADVRGHVVYKLDGEGHVLLTLGKKGVSGDAPGLFNGPTDVIVMPAGDVFVTDGQFNSRVLHYTANGTFVKSFGTNGTAPGQFKVPHAIGLDSAGRLFVADRDNDRIQIFDQNGRFLDQWTNFGQPSGLFIDANDRLYVAVIGQKSGLAIGSARTGQVEQFLPIPAKDLNGPHLVTADTRGNVYVADLLASDVRKFIRN